MITIRTADEPDAAALLEYLATLRAERLPTIFRHPALPSIDEERSYIRGFDGERGACFVAIVDDKIIGNLGVSAHQHSQLAHGATLGMSVLAAYRRRGIGSRLLDASIDFGERRALRRLELEVFSNNPGAIRLYERKGFVVEGCRRRAVEVDGLFVDLLLMARRLGTAA